METTNTPFSEQEFKVGSTVYVVFEPGEPGKQSRFISKAENRKHVIPAYGDVDDIEPGLEYQVELKKDTLPGMNGGAYLGEVVSLSEFGDVQKQKKEEGYLFKGSYSKSIFETEEELKEVLLKSAPGFSNSDFSITPYGSGSGGAIDHNRFGAWMKDKNTIPFTTRDNVDRVDPIAPDVVAPFFKEIDKNTVAAIEEMDKDVRIVDKVAEIVGDDDKLVPSLEQFKHFVVDKRAAEILRRATSAFNRRSPLLLVGDTDTSKTSSLELFAATVKMKYFRLNLSGQTDTGEIIGKFVPNDGAQRRKYENLIEGWSDSDEQVREKTYSRVGSEAAKILKEVLAKGGTPDEGQSMLIASKNGLNIGKGDWVFQYGYLPMAMIHGGMFLVDEVFLAEPQINERMNSALEQVPSLVISENGNLKIGPGGDFSVHPNFWFVGATNSSGMAGRAEQSDAFLRRWRDYVLLDQPEQSDYKDMMAFLITGEHPKFEVDGIKYQMPGAEPIYPDLEKLPGIGEAIVRLSKFHMDVRRKAHPETGAPTIGKDRQKKGGKYTYTRSTLLSVMEMLQKEKTIDMVKSKKEGRLVFVTDLDRRIKEAVQKYYIDPALREDAQAIKDSWNMLVGGSGQKL